MIGWIFIETDQIPVWDEAFILGDDRLYLCMGRSNGNSFHEVEMDYLNKFTFIRGADKDSRIIVGPLHGRSEKIEPMVRILEEMHEVTGKMVHYFPEQREVLNFIAILRAGEGWKQ